MRLSFALLALASLGSLATAQTTTVFPSDWAATAGNSSENRYPLSAGISRTQIVYDRRDLTITNNHPITQVGFRQDDNTASAGKSIQLAIYMGSTTKTSATMTSNYANNYDGATPRTLVFGPSIVALPTFTNNTNLQELWITLTTPYTYHSNENLIVEYVVTANNNANLAFNYYIDNGGYLSPTQSIGTGCITSAGQVPLLAVQNYSYLGGYLYYNLSRAPASSLVWLNLDFVQTPPIDCAPFGAPGCTLYVLPQVALAAQGNTGGAANFQFQLPADPALFHAQVFGQCSIFDLFANNLGFTFSNSTKITLGMYPLAAMVYSTGSASATTGSVRRDDCPISLFRWN